MTRAAAGLVPRDREDLYLIVRPRMAIFARVQFSLKKFKLRPGEVDLVDPLRCTAFANAVATEAFLYLKVAVPRLDDPDLLRHKLMFSCRTFYDFATGQSREGVPADRVRRHAAATFQKPNIPGELLTEAEGPDGLFASFFDFISKGGTSIMDSLASHSFDPLKKLAQRIKDLVERPGRC